MTSILKIVINNEILSDKFNIIINSRFFDLIILSKSNVDIKKKFNNTNVVRFFWVLIKSFKFVELFDNLIYYLC